MSSIEENLRRFIKQVGQTKTIPTVSVGIAKNINGENRTCDIQLNDALTLFNCRLNAIIGNYENNILILPKEGSFVAYALLDDRNTEVLVIGYTEIDKINIKIGDTTIDISNDKIELNGGLLGGLIKIEELKSQLDKMTQRIDGIMNALRNSPTGSSDGGAAYKTAITTALSSITNKENFGNIEDEKITH